MQEKDSESFQNWYTTIRRTQEPVKAAGTLLVAHELKRKKRTVETLQFLPDL
jgi:hypothetical protein